MRPLKASLVALTLASSALFVACGGDDAVVGDEDTGSTEDSGGIDTKPRDTGAKDAADTSVVFDVSDTAGDDTAVTDTAEAGTDTAVADTLDGGVADTRDGAVADTLDGATADTADGATTDTADATVADTADALTVDVLPDTTPDVLADSDAAVLLSELWVVRVGDGSALATSGSAAAVFIDKFASDGTPRGTIPLPTVTAGSQQKFTLTNNSNSEGFLTLSTDGHYVTLAGYSADVGTASVTGATAGAPRIVARIGAVGTADTSTILGTTSFAGSNVRAAISTDGNAIWVAGTASTGTNGGVHYTTFGATGDSGQLSTSPTNVRTVAIFGGQLYTTSGSSTFFGPATVGTGLPTTTGQTSTLLPGFSTSTGSPYQFLAFDRDATAGIDTIYIADDSTTTGGIQRWKLASGTWSKDATFSDATLTALRALSGEVVGGNVVLYAVSNANKLVTMTDTGGTTATFSTIATAATNTIYRGVSLAPR